MTVSRKPRDKKVLSMNAELLAYLCIAGIAITLISALFLTIRFRFIQVRGFFTSWKIVSGMLDQPQKPENLTQFKAFLAGMGGIAGAGLFGMDPQQGPWFFLACVIAAPLQFALAASLRDSPGWMRALAAGFAFLAGLAFVAVQGAAQHASTETTAANVTLVVLVLGLSLLWIGAAGWIAHAAGLLTVVLVGVGLFSGAFTDVLYVRSPRLTSAVALVLLLAELFRGAFVFTLVRSAPERSGFAAMLCFICAPVAAFALWHGRQVLQIGEMNLASMTLLALWLFSWGFFFRAAFGRFAALPGVLFLLVFVVSRAVVLPGPWMYSLTILFSLAALIAYSLIAVRGSSAAAAALSAFDQKHRWLIGQDVYLIFLTILPQNLVSRMFGWIAATPLPRFLREPVILAYARAFGVTVEEAEKEIPEYRSLNRFFTRYLKPGARPLEGDEGTVASPVDGTVLRFGDITEGLLIQAKAMQYSLADLLEFPEYQSRFEGGKFLVIYLSPRDYHRIHFHAGGKVPGYTYSPGDLFTVNPAAVERLEALFAKNERLTTYIENPRGLTAIVKVGATNVGRIRLEYDNYWTNRWFRRPFQKKYAEPLAVTRGQEMGRFEMGSTVILLFEKNSVEFLPVIQEKNKVRFGQGIAKWKSG